MNQELQRLTEAMEMAKNDGAGSSQSERMDRP
jgi:hypothetical protein